MKRKPPRILFSRDSKLSFFVKFLFHLEIRDSCLKIMYHGNLVICPFYHRMGRPNNKKIEIQMNGHPCFGNI